MIGCMRETSPDPSFVSWHPSSRMHRFGHMIEINYVPNGHTIYCLESCHQGFPPRWIETVGAEVPKRLGDLGLILFARMSDMV